MDRTELAWAAGFWDAEGSAYLTRARHRPTRHPRARINQSSPTGIPHVLVRFQRILGLGRVRGPVLQEGREPLYRWEVSSRADVASTFAALRPYLGMVKRRQFEVVLGEPAVYAQDVGPAEVDVARAWAAGLFDGDGSTYLAKHRSHAGQFYLEAALTQSSWTGVPEILPRFANVVGCGRVYGPYPLPAPHAPVYRWRACRRAQIEAMIERLLPYLDPVRRDQALVAFAAISAQPILPRGNPAWGNRKTLCVHGHDYETARLRPFRSRGKNSAPRRASHQCLACVREAARAKRLMAKTENGGSRRRSRKSAR